MQNDIYYRDWIKENALEVISEYERGVLTIRALHYRLVARGMINSTTHYKRVVAAMGAARKDGLIPYETFSDHERSPLGETSWEKTSLDSEVDKAKSAIESWMSHYFKNRWENQDYYLEIWIEKKALQGVVEPVARRNDLLLFPCKGYPSLTALKEASERFWSPQANGKRNIILYLGDYDPSGEDIPRNINQSLTEEFGIEVEVDRVFLMEDQVRELNLPPAPTKTGDSRSVNWQGIGQVELDAIPFDVMTSGIQIAIDNYFDPSKHEELRETENREMTLYRKELKDFVKTL